MTGSAGMNILIPDFLPCSYMSKKEMIMMIALESIRSAGHLKWFHLLIVIILPLVKTCAHLLSRVMTRNLVLHIDGQDDLIPF